MFTVYPLSMKTVKMLRKRVRFWPPSDGVRFIVRQCILAVAQEARHKTDRRLVFLVCDVIRPFLIKTGCGGSGHRQRGCLLYRRPNAPCFSHPTKENLQVPQSPLGHPADQDELDKGPQTVANNGDDVTTIWTSLRTLLQKAMDRSIPSSKRQ